MAEEACGGRLLAVLIAVFAFYMCVAKSKLCFPWVRGAPAAGLRLKSPRGEVVGLASKEMGTFRSALSSVPSFLFTALVPRSFSAIFPVSHYRIDTVTSLYTATSYV